MKAYVHDQDTCLGQAICDALQAHHVEVVSKHVEHVQPEKHEDRHNLNSAVIEQPDSGASESAPSGALPETEQLQAGKDLQPDAGTADLDEAESFPPNVLVYTLSAAGDSIQQALSALAKQKPSNGEQFFIAITTPLSWARTQLLPESSSPPVQPVQPPATSSSVLDTDPSQEVTDSLEHTDAALTATQNAAGDVSVAPLSSADVDRRKAAACARTVLEAERVILAANSKSLRTYVVCPGVLYGHGETDDGLHHIFKTAWEAHPNTPVPVFGTGQNIIPTIHVADLAAYVAAVCIEPPMQHYLLAVDNAQLRQRDIVSAIAVRMGNAPVREQTLEALYSQQGMEHMLLNLPMTRTPLANPVQLQYADGIVAHLDAVAQQYIDRRSLQPLRLMLTGPPAVGKSSLASRLAQHYQLPLVSVKSILAAADELGGSTKQEVQAELGGKGGRVTDGNMVKLCSHVLGHRDLSVKGFVLEGWPKTREQAQQLFTREDPYTPEERQRLEAVRDAQTSAAGKDQPAPVKGKPAKPDPKGKAAAKPELPKRHTPIVGLFPTHVISLEAAEPSLLSRCSALGEQEQAAARATAAADGKPMAAAAGKGKPTGPMTHNNDKDFKRRFAAYKASHEGDSGSQQAFQSAQQLWWDDTRALLEADAEAEAEVEKAATAKTMRLTALASMKFMAPAGLGATMGASSRASGFGATMGGSIRHSGAFPMSRSDAGSPLPGESTDGSRKGTPPPSLPAAAALAAHMKQGVPQIQHGGLLGVFAAHHAQVLVVDTDQPSGLETVVSDVTLQVGPPHNYSATAAAPDGGQPAEVSTPAAAPEAADEADAPHSEHLTPEQAAEKQHVDRCRAEAVAMKAEPMKRYLMQQLMPVLAKAMVDATYQQAPDAVQFVAQQLMEPGKLLDLQYVDPYAAEIYIIQQNKWDLKQKKTASAASSPMTPLPA